MRQDANIRKLRPLAASILLGCMLALGACDSKGGSVEDLMKRAQAHRAEGNIRASVIELKNVLQKEPQNAQARLMLGQAFIDLGDNASAEIELKRARESAPQAETALILLAEAKLHQGRYDEVLKDFAVTDEYSKPTKAALLAVRGSAHMRLNQAAQAEQAFEAATQQDENALTAWIGLARLAVSGDKLDKARGYLARAVAVAPNDPKTLALQGDVAFLAGDYSGAEQAFRQVLKIRKDDLAALSAQLGVARAQLAAGNIKDATTRLTQVLKAAPSDPATNYLRALAAYRSKDYQTAKTHSEIVLRSQPNHRPATFLAGASSYALGQYEQAYKYLNNFVAEVPDNVDGRKLLAATQLRVGQASKAAGTLRPALGKAGEEDAQLLSMIGVATARAGDLPGASRYFEKAVAAHPDNASLRTRLGVTRIALGNTDAGIEDLEAASKLESATGDADTTLFIALLRAKEYDKALEVAKRVQEKKPTEPNGYNFAAMAYAGKNDTAQAKASFLKALEVSPGDRNAARNLATMALKDQNFDEARGYYEQILKRFPNDIEALVLLGQLEIRAKRPQEAVARFEQAISANSDATLPRAALARHYLVTDEPAKALAAVQPGLQKHGADPGLLEVAGRAQLALGQFPDAIATFQGLVAARPEASAAYLYLATAYERAGNATLALSEIDRALRIAPADPALRFEQARLLAATGKVDQAAKILADMRQSYPDNPSIAGLEGALALSMNRPADAVAAFKRAFDAQPNDVTVVRLASAEARAGRVPDAQKTLENWVKEHQKDVFARSTLGQLYLSTKQYPKAEAEYVEISRLAPNNAVAFNNLAWLMTEQGRGEEALPHARHAAELAPENADIAETLGYVLLQTNKAGEAVSVLRKAAEKAPTNSAVQFRLAQALARDGKQGEARDILRKIVADQKQAAQREPAEKLLRELGG